MKNKSLFLVAIFLALLIISIINMPKILNFFSDDKEGLHKVEYESLSETQEHIISKLVTSALLTALEEQKIETFKLSCPMVATGTVHPILESPYILSYFGNNSMTEDEKEKLSYSFRTCLKNKRWVDIKKDKIKLYSIIDYDLTWDYKIITDQVSKFYPLWSNVIPQELLAVDEMFPGFSQVEIQVSKTTKCAHLDGDIFDSLSMSLYSKKGTLAETRKQQLFEYENVIFAINVKEINIENKPFPFKCPKYVTVPNEKDMENSKTPQEIFNYGIYHIQKKETDLTKAYYWINIATVVESTKQKEYLEFKNLLDQVIPHSAMPKNYQNKMIILNVEEKK